MQGLTLSPYLGFRRVPCPALAAEALLQVGLLLLEFFPLVLEVALLLTPGAMGAGQGLHGLLQPGLLGGQGLLLVPQTFNRQLPLAAGIQQLVASAAGCLQPLVGGFLFRLQLSPGRGIVVVAADALRLIQGLELCCQGGERSADRFQPLLLFGLILLQLAEPFGPLAAALEQRTMVAPGRIALGDQGRLLLFQFAQLRFLLLD